MDRHLRLNGFDPIALDGRDPASIAWGIHVMESRLQAGTAVPDAHVRLPYGIAETVKGFGFPGAGRAYVQAIGNRDYSMIMGTTLIYAVLVLLFRDFFHPFTILTALPLSIGGAFAALLIANQPLSLFVLIGLIMLMGLVTKNAILLIDFTNQARKRGLDRFAALQEAGQVRLRPILMTTAAMVIGVVPLLIADGAGAKSRFDIGVVIAAGMTIGTFFTLFITPAIYSYVARDRRHMHDLENESDVLEHEVVTTPANDGLALPKAAE